MGVRAKDLPAALPRESDPGVAYAIRGDSGNRRRLVRIELIESPCCGAVLALESQNDNRRFRCPYCRRLWRVRMLNHAGAAPILALVLSP